MNKQNSHTIFQDVAEILPLSFSIVSLEGKVLFANRHALKLFEIGSLEELKDLKVPLVWKDPSKREEWVKNLLEKGSVRNVETEMVSASGKRIWLLASGLLTTYQSQPAILSIHNEITERKIKEESVKASEKWFRTLADTTASGIFIYQGNKFVYANRAICRITGYSHEEFLGLSPLWDVVHPDYKAIARERAAARQEGKEVPENYELKIVCKDGTVKWLDISAGVIEWQGKSAGIGSAFDITRRKEALERVNALLGEKDIILKEAHHRVKNNMSVISGLLSLQADNVEGSECEALLLDAASRAQSMMVLYDKLYRTSDVGSLNLKEYLESLVQEIIKPFYPSFALSTQLSIENFELGTEILSSLGIIINELVTNSMKHAFVGRSGGSISIITSKGAAGIDILYRDDGVGIPDEIDFNTESTFGLQLIRLLAEQIGSAVELQRGEGTTFVLHLPF